MKFFHRSSLSALMLTTMAASAMSVTGTAAPADAAFFRERDFFTQKYASKFFVRGRCFISNGKGGVVVDFANGLVEIAQNIPTVKVVAGVIPTIPDSAKKIFPAAGQVKCIAKKRKRARGALRASGDVTVNMKTYGPTRRGRRAVWGVIDRKSKTCGGKKRCTLIIKPRSKKVTGLTACIQAKDSSRIVKVGEVPSRLNNGFSKRPCSRRRY